MFIVFALFFVGNSVPSFSENYIGSFKTIKESLFKGIVEQISSAIILGPGVGYFDTHGSLGGLRFVSNIEDSSLFLRLVFEVGLIPVFLFSLFIILYYREGYKYLLYVVAASLSVGHYHTAYLFGILVGALMMMSEKKTNAISPIPSPGDVSVS